MSIFVSFFVQTGSLSAYHRTGIERAQYNNSPTVVYVSCSSQPPRTQTHQTCSSDKHLSCTRAADLHWLSHTILSKLHSPRFFPTHDYRPGVCKTCIHIFSYIIICLLIHFIIFSFIRLFYFLETTQPRISSEVIPNNTHAVLLTYSIFTFFLLNQNFL